MLASFDLSIPLDAAIPASNPQRFSVRGKYIQIDPGSTGEANLRINSVSDTPRLAYPGQQFSPGDFTDLYFDYIAQPGKFLHVVYGDTPDILSAGARVNVDPSLPKTTFFVHTGVLGSTVLVTAAQNKRGIKILGGVLQIQTVNVLNSWMYIDVHFDANNFICTLTQINPNAFAFYNTKEIPALYVPPGQSLSYALNGAGGGETAGIILNYEVL